MYIRTLWHICVYVWIHKYICIYVCLYTYIYAYMYLCMYMHIHTYTHYAYTYSYKYTYTHNVYTDSYIYIYVYANIYVYIYCEVTKHSRTVFLTSHLLLVPHSGMRQNGEAQGGARWQNIHAAGCGNLPTCQRILWHSQGSRRRVGGESDVRFLKCLTLVG